MVTQCGCSGTGVSRLVWNRETRMHIYICMYMYIDRWLCKQVRFLRRLRIWVGHELIVYNESALNRRVDAMWHGCILEVYRDSQLEQLDRLRIPLRLFLWPFPIIFVSEKIANLEFFFISEWKFFSLEWMCCYELACRSGKSNLKNIQEFYLNLPWSSEN